MAIVINDNIQILAPKPPDDRSLRPDNTPYVSTTEVNTIIIPSRRYITLTVNIAGVEYWYYPTVADVDLVVKSVSGGNEMVGAAATALANTANWKDPNDPNPTVQENVNYPFYTGDLTPFASYREHDYCIVEDTYSGSIWEVKYKKIATVLKLYRIAILIKNLA